MIRTLDVLLLARTKLRTRRIRLGVLLVTMSLLFAGLVFIANIAQGTVQSVKSFSKEGFGNAFYVQAHPQVYLPFGDDKLVKQLQPQQDALVVQKKALAKKLNLQYEAKTDPDLYYTDQQNGPNPTDVQAVLTSSVLAQTALEAQNKTIPNISFDAFTQQANQAGATATYRSSGGAGSYQGPTTSSGSINVLLNGKEEYTDQKKSYQGPPIGVSSIQTLGWGQMSDGLLKPFLLSGQTTEVGDDGSIPIIAPFSAAEQVLNFTRLPPTANAQQKLGRLVQVRQQIAGKTAQLCYRNSASQALLQKASQQQTEIAANRNNKDYTLPHLLYNLPSEACGATTIKLDKRTADEKKADANQQQFGDTFTPAAAPIQGNILLRIIGITPDIDMSNTSLSASGVLSNILTSSVGTGWFSPSNAFKPGSLATQAQNGTISEQPLGAQVYYASFPTLAQETAFIKQSDCHILIGPPANGNFNPNAQTDACAAKHKPFTIVPYGNNAGAIADFQHTVWRFLRFVLLGVVLVTVIVMMGTFGKVIADSRRETAVFRSLGASRFAISQIYLTYTALVCLMVALFALIVGSLASSLLTSHISPGLSVSAVLAYNAHDVHKHFSISGYNPLYLSAILALIMIAGFISASIPLLLNMRRNPIQDMREE